MKDYIVISKAYLEESILKLQEDITESEELHKKHPNIQIPTDLNNHRRTMMSCYQEILSADERESVMEDLLEWLNNSRDWDFSYNPDKRMWYRIGSASPDPSAPDTGIYVTSKELVQIYHEEKLSNANKDNLHY